MLINKLYIIKIQLNNKQMMKKLNNKKKIIKKYKTIINNKIFKNKIMILKSLK